MTLSPLSWCPAPQEEASKFLPAVIAQCPLPFPWGTRKVNSCSLLCDGAEKGSILSERPGLVVWSCTVLCPAGSVDFWCHLEVSANPVLPLWHMIHSWSWLPSKTSNTSTGAAVACCQLIINPKAHVIQSSAARDNESSIREVIIMLIRPCWVPHGETLTNWNFLGEEWLEELRDLKETK